MKKGDLLFLGSFSLLKILIHLPVLPRERRFVVAVCRKPREDLHEIWVRERNYGF